MLPLVACSIAMCSIVAIATVQLRCNFTLAREQFTHTLEPFTPAHIEILMASVLLPASNSSKIIT